MVLPLQLLMWLLPLLVFCTEDYYKVGHTLK